MYVIVLFLLLFYKEFRKQVGKNFSSLNDKIYMATMRQWFRSKLIARGPFDN